MDQGPADILRRVYEGDVEGEAYHAPALGRVLEGLSAAEAAARPLAQAHSIVELVYHLAAWLEWSAAALERRRHDLADDGWVRIGALDASGWQQARARLDAAYRSVLASLASRPGALGPREDEVVRFALHHLLHHGGQVTWIAGAQRRGGGASV